MTIDEKLDILIGEMQNVKDEVKNVKDEVKNVKDEVQNIKDDISSLKRSALILESDIAPKVQILLENHSDLAKNVMVAKDIEERIGVLEFDVRLIKNMLKSKAI